MKFKYAICNELYQGWEHERAFAHAANLGYAGIEIAPFTLANDVSAISDRQINAVVDAAKNTGVEIIGLHWLLAKTQGLHLTSPQTEVRESTARYLGLLAKLTKSLGGSLMVLGSPQQRSLEPGISNQQGNQYAVEVLQATAEKLQRTHVTLALEPLSQHETNFMLSARETVEVAKAVDSPFVKLHLDVKAMCSEADPIEQIIQDNAQWMVHFHANDPNRQGPGMGDIPFLPILRALDNSGYHDWISVEVFDYTPGIDALAGDSIRYLKSIETQLQDE